MFRRHGVDKWRGVGVVGGPLVVRKMVAMSKRYIVNPSMLYSGKV